MKSLVIDGYVDEPACFGVPPYISPYVRYCAGVLYSHGCDVAYRTCDAWRAAKEETNALVADADIVVVIVGMTVPGRYRGGSPLTLRELEEIAGLRRRGELLLGGPIKNGYTLRGGSSARAVLPTGVDCMAWGDPEASLDRYCRSGVWENDIVRDDRRLAAVATAGALLARQHPDYPRVIAEMELSRGCDRTDGKCSFCTEGNRTTYEERPVQDVADETAALSREGIAAFRLGRCSNILAYGADRTPAGFRPNASALEELYRGIRSAAPHLEVLHTDNCNPATIARFPNEARRALEAIVRCNTEGDGLSFGLESLDPAVYRANGLKVAAAEALLAVRIVNEVGGVRKTPRSLPSLLPGLNFLSGLAGETGKSFSCDAAFLQCLLDEGLAVRRINIRRAIVFGGSPLERARAENPSRAKERDYRKWKEWVRKEVDPVMLERVAPDGTVLRGVIAEERSGKVVFGRQLGSYPPLVGIVSERLQPGDRTDVMISGRGGRSVTGVRWPLAPDDCTAAELAALPGIGRSRAAFLLSRRPFGSAAAFEKTLREVDAPGIAERLMPYFTDDRRDEPA